MSLKKYNMLGALSFFLLALFGFFHVNFFTALIMLAMSGLLALFFYAYSKEVEHKMAKFLNFVGFSASLIMSLAMFIRMIAVLFVSAELHIAANGVALTAYIIFSLTFIMTSIRFLTNNRSDLVLVIASLLIIVLLVISMLIPSQTLFFVTMLIYALLFGYMFFSDITL